MEPRHCGEFFAALGRREKISGLHRFASGPHGSMSPWLRPNIRKPCAAQPRQAIRIGESRRHPRQRSPTASRKKAPASRLTVQVKWRPACERAYPCADGSPQRIACLAMYKARELVGNCLQNAAGCEALKTRGLQKTCARTLLTARIQRQICGISRLVSTPRNRASLRSAGRGFRTRRRRRGQSLQCRPGALR
jgi:hypothetical protein